MAEESLFFLNMIDIGWLRHLHEQTKISVPVTTIMPKQRKGSSSSLGRKSIIARKAHERRRCESLESKERRRLQNRVSVSSARQQESPESRERRLQ